MGKESNYAYKVIFYQNKKEKINNDNNLQENN